MRRRLAGAVLALVFAVGGTGSAVAAPARTVTVQQTVVRSAPLPTVRLAFVEKTKSHSVRRTVRFGHRRSLVSRIMGGLLGMVLLFVLVVVILVIVLASRRRRR